MQTFIRNLLLFLLVLCSVAVLLIGTASLYMNRVEVKLDKTKNILVVGDSHTECAIDDSVFKRAANMSKSATPFIYSMAAMRKLVSDNPQIDTILLSFNSGSLWYEREKVWVFGEAEIAEQIPVFLPYFSVSDMAVFLLEPQFYLSALETPRTALDYHLNARKGKAEDWIHEKIGHFRKMDYSVFSKDTGITKPIVNTEKREPLSMLSLDYLHKFNKFCMEKNIVLILINTPVYKWKTYANYAEVDENNKRFLKDFLFVDYADFPVADSCRFDIWHLNQHGAVQFSKYLESNLAADIKKQQSGN